MNQQTATDNGQQLGKGAAYLPAMHGFDGTDYDVEVYEAMAMDYAFFFGIGQAESDLAAGRISRNFYELILDMSKNGAAGFTA